VGGLKDIHLNARIIAASNRNLKQESDSGDFRLDLYFRLSVIQIDIPPLRDRGSDVITLAKYYIDKANLKRRGKLLRGLAPDVERIFRNYRWSGNVRELRNVIERASILEDGEVVTSVHLPADMLGTSSSGPEGSTSTFVLPAVGVSLEAVEFDLAKQAFERTEGNLTRAAKLLDISRDQLRYKLRKAGLDTETNADQ
jgi:DNA-binding NtrC family response regulator